MMCDDVERIMELTCLDCRMKTIFFQTATCTSMSHHISCRKLNLTCKLCFVYFPKCDIVFKWAFMLESNCRIMELCPDVTMKLVCI